MKYYRVRADTSCWLVIDSADVPFVTEREVIFDERDLKRTTNSEFAFHLPPNNKRAEWMIVCSDLVEAFELVKKFDKPPRVLNLNDIPFIDKDALEQLNQTLSAAGVSHIVEAINDVMKTAND